MLIRALIYRIVTLDLVHGPEGWTRDEIAAHHPAIEVALAHAG